MNAKELERLLEKTTILHPVQVLLVGRVYHKEG
jgi:hypothetical protein